MCTPLQQLQKLVFLVLFIYPEIGILFLNKLVNTVYSKYIYYLLFNLLYYVQLLSGAWNSRSTYERTENSEKYKK